MVLNLLWLASIYNVKIDSGSSNFFEKVSFFAELVFVNGYIVNFVFDKFRGKFFCKSGTFNRFHGIYFCKLGQILENIFSQKFLPRKFLPLRYTYWVESPQKVALCVKKTGLFSVQIVISSVTKIWRHVNFSLVY